jgi:hypothetical protein
MNWLFPEPHVLHPIASRLLWWLGFFSLMPRNSQFSRFGICREFGLKAGWKESGI